MPALSRVDDWKWDYNTMPGWAGSSWYFLRYLSPDCDTSFVSEEGLKYWKQPDIYIGGSEHAVGHLIYARFWTMFLFDLGLIPFSEPFPKMRNQGMMTAPSYRVARKGDAIYSFDSKPDGCVEEYVEYKYVDFQNDSLLVDEFIKENPHINTSDTSITLRKEVEKMSKSKYNVINPNDIVNTYGADTLRLYEMFMGPIEHSKPWDMNSIQGCYRFIRSVYDYYIDASPNWVDDARSEPKKCLSELSTKIEKDLEDFNLNTIVSSFMVCFKALKDEKTVKQDWVDFIAMLSIYAPFIGAELLDKLDVSNPTYPVYPVYKTTKSILMKIMIGGKFMESCEPMSEQGTLSYVCSKYNIEASKVGKVIFKENFMFNVILC
jgi:leucyl-tRNA synthetase